MGKALSPAREGSARRDADRVRDIDAALKECYGDRPWSPRFDDLLDGLVHTILSQNTNDENSRRAFRRLKERFPTWEAAASAPMEEVEEAIRPGGISRVKAGRIKELLRKVKEDHGGYSLAPLEDMEPDRAMAYLLDIPGVGRKTASVLLLFQLGHPYFPVDTHVLRVGRRLGLIPRRAGAVRAHLIMDELVPDDIKYRLHLNLVEHGRRVCRARNPLCGECRLRGSCPRIGLEEEEKAGRGGRPGG